MRQELQNPHLLPITKSCDTFRITIHPMTYVELRFEDDKKRLDCSLVNTGERYVLKVMQGKVVFISDDGRGVPVSPEQIAESVLNHAAQFI